MLMNVEKCTCDVLSNPSAPKIAFQWGAFLKLLSIDSQVGPFDIVHGIKWFLVVVAVVIDLDDIWVVKAKKLLNFLIESSEGGWMALCQPFKCDPFLF